MNEQETQVPLIDLRKTDLKSLPSITVPMKTALDRILARDTDGNNNYFNQYIGNGA